MQYTNETFDGVAVELDGNSFEHCTFRDVLFSYSGGELNMTDCKIESFGFHFGGALGTGLFTLHQLFGGEGMIQIIRGFTDPTPGEVELAPREEPASN